MAMKDDRALQESPTKVKFPCIKVSQPIGTFYVGVMRWQDLCAIADFDVRRVIQKERDVEKYLGIQRPLNDDRVDDLARYVTTLDASFPTSVVLAVPGKCAQVSADGRMLVLENKVTQSEKIDPDDQDSPVYFRNIARVLDGQHRIKGLMEGFKNPESAVEFDVPVTIFVEIDIAEQAQIFATVNLEQTKVNKSLAYDLFALAKSRSPIKTCHNAAMALDQNKESALFKRIKRLGVATEGRFGETISQHQFVEALLPYISWEPEIDRDKILRGKKIERIDADQSMKLIFRNMFIEGRDLDITEIVFNYFLAVRDRWPGAWDELGQGYVLARTNGFRALMRFLRPAYLYVTKPGGVVSKDRFASVLARVPLRDADFTVDRYVPGSTGEGALYRDMLSALKR